MKTITTTPTRREKGQAEREIRNDKRLNDRLNKLGAIRFSEVANLFPNHYYQQVRVIFSKMMEEKIAKGEAEKLCNGCYWIMKNKYCLN